MMLLDFSDVFISNFSFLTLLIWIFSLSLLSRFGVQSEPHDSWRLWTEFVFILLISFLSFNIYCCLLLLCMVASFNSKLSGMMLLLV